VINNIHAPSYKTAKKLITNYKST